MRIGANAIMNQNYLTNDQKGLRMTQRFEVVDKTNFNSRIEDYKQNSGEFLWVDDLLLPAGIEITINEILNSKNLEPITVDKNNVIQGGIITYLLAIKNGQKKVMVIRTHKLQKIIIALSSKA
jgi:ribosomal protein L21